MLSPFSHAHLLRDAPLKTAAGSTTLELVPAEVSGTPPPGTPPPSRPPKDNRPPKNPRFPPPVDPADPPVTPERT